jgi:hypothetical protein
MIRHFSHIFLVEGLTFIIFSKARQVTAEPDPDKGLVSRVRGRGRPGLNAR